MQAAGLGFVIGAGNQNFIALDLDGHQGLIVGIQAALGAVSYTHLDVYKRQAVV